MKEATYRISFTKI